MDYDGLSSHESQQSREVASRLPLGASRFVILWHAMPPGKPGSRADSDASESMALAPDCAIPPGATGQVSGITDVANSHGRGWKQDRASHFDLMLEKGERLITFELLQLPIPGERFPVRSLADHRMHYLDYEGPISGNRGHVTQWTAGHYFTVADTSQKWVFELYSERLSARLVLLRPSCATIEHPSSWQLRASRWSVRS